MSNEPHAEMEQESPDEDLWWSYRCPVCGHTDSVSPSGEPKMAIRCSHCGTDLEVSAPVGGRERATVHVRRDADGGQGKL